MNSTKRMRNLFFTLVFFLALTCIAGFGQMAMDDIKEAKSRFGVTLEWQEKSSMKYDTIDQDWSDEEPMKEELS